MIGLLEISQALATQVSKLSQIPAASLPSVFASNGETTNMSAQLRS